MSSMAAPLPGPSEALRRRPATPLRARAVILDLDGTLLDTAADFAVAANAMRADLGFAPLAAERIATFIGRGMSVLVHRVLADHPDGQVDATLHERGMTVFLAHYARENGRSARLYPGVIEGLDRLAAQSLPLACVTNKPQAFAEPLLARFDLARRFRLIVGGDALPTRKPDPGPMRHVAQVFDVPAASVVAIGDSRHDAQAARAAGMPVIAVSYGYNEGADVAALDVDAIVDSIADAAALIQAHA